MKRYEKIALALALLGLALALYLAGVSDAGTINLDVLWPLELVSIALLIAAGVVAKHGWERETGEKAVLFFDFGTKNDPTE